MECKRPFSLHKRPPRHGRGRNIYYCQFRLQDGGYATARSTGQSSRGAAEAWAWAELKRTGGAVPLRGGLTLEAYAESWWYWDRCDYIKRKLARGSSISPGYAEAMRSYLNHWILPRIGSKRLSRITTRDVESWVMDLHENTILAPATINHCLKCLRIMLREAERLGYISIDPTRRVSELAENSEQKGILTLEEVRELFWKDKISTVWDGDLRHFTINLLAASTGMRMGECQGLQVQHVHEDHVAVLHSWARKHGLKEPKWNSTRLIPLPGKTSRCLQELLAASPYKEPEDLVFYGTDRRRAVGHRDVLDWLYLALRHIGINEKERQARSIAFHSWRVWFNTLCRLNKIPDAKVRRLTGHKTEAMTELYTSFKLEDFNDVLKVQEAAF